MRVVEETIAGGRPNGRLVWARTRTSRRSAASRTPLPRGTGAEYDGRPHGVRRAAALLPGALPRVLNCDLQPQRVVLRAVERAAVHLLDTEIEFVVARQRGSRNIDVHRDALARVHVVRQRDLLRRWERAVVVAPRIPSGNEPDRVIRRRTVRHRYGPRRRP